MLLLHNTMGSNCGNPSLGFAEAERNVSRVLQSEGNGLSVVLDLFDFLKGYISPVTAPEPPAVKCQPVGIEVSPAPEEATVFQGKGGGAERDVGKGKKHGTGRRRRDVDEDVSHDGLNGNRCVAGEDVGWVALNSPQVGSRPDLTSRTYPDLSWALIWSKRARYGEGEEDSLGGD